MNESKNILITGASTGIGYALSQAFIHKGYSVYGSVRKQADADRVAAELGERFHPVLFDVTDHSAVEQAAQQLKAELGTAGLGGLVNNAGIAGPTALIEDITEADWPACLDVCLTGQYMATRRAVPLLKAAGGGAIVNMSSAAGKHGYAYRTPYSAAKFGVIGLTQSLAKELGPYNIRVNAVLPGFVEGPRMDSVIARKADVAGVSYGAMHTEYLEAVSLRRMVSAQDVANTVSFLVSDLGANLSGQSLAVDGNVEYLK